ncbi:MAG: hypothetical protein GY850_38705 [bacterium]|nr:hypothetical protein [bacterium]
MNRKIKTRLSTIILSGLILASMSLMPGLGLDARAKSKTFGNSEISYDGERPVHPRYPRLFDIVGQIDRIAADEAVIDDSLYRLSPAVAYHTPNHRNTLQSWLQVGDVVGCLIDSNGEIKSIWRIAEKEQ